MRVAGQLDLRVTQPGAQAPALVIAPVHGTFSATLDRDDVEELRDACEEFLAGRPLQR